MRIRRLLVALFATLALLGPWAVSPAKADTAVDLYSTPGVHLVNDRYWRTECSMYSTTVVRCRTEIYGTKVYLSGGTWYKQNDWVFNNLSYLPSNRADWATNNLGKTMQWTGDDGRRWESECDTAATGRGACRHYIWVTVASETNGLVKQQDMRVFNSMVRFATPQVPAVHSVPAAVPVRSDVPTPSVAVPLRVASAVPAPVAPVPSTKPTQAGGRYAPISRANCPSHAPIKGNANSGIYHMPGQRYYSRTHPEDCFATQADAVRAGYRKAKV